jgi:protein-disulfide isomerase
MCARPIFVLVAFTATLAVACTTSEKAAKVSATRHVVDCAGASIAIEPADVVGTLDGEAITYGDLGKEVPAAEKRALFEYCDAVYAARSQALDGRVSELVVKKAALGAGMAVEEWMAAEVRKRVVDPTDAEIQAFYDQRKRPDAPPLEDVKGQVSMIIGREKNEEAARTVLADLRRAAVFVASLPDVRSPARDVAITAHTASKGKKGAKVNVIEFADFQCPYCSQAAASMSELEKKYGARVEFAYRHFPLRSIHPDAQRAGELSQCAAAQGKFWEMHDKIYAAQHSLDEASLRAHAVATGVDVAKLDECLATGRGTAEVNQDFDEASEIGVAGTPTFFVNGRQHTGPPTVEGLSAAIEDALKE